MVVLSMLLSAKINLKAIQFCLTVIESLDKRTQIASKIDNNLYTCVIPTVSLPYLNYVEYINKKYLAFLS
jgi:hypothetical protein